MSDKAFPHVCGSNVREEGLTKREWYAGMALSGIITAHDADQTSQVIADMAFLVADAMIAESEKE